MYASALAVSPRLHSSFSENMFSVTAHGMRVRGARACSTPINGMVPAPLASTHKNTWSAASRRYPRMRRVTGGNTTPRWSVDAPPTRPQRYGCAHTASKRTFTERYTRLTRGASLCPFCRLLRVYSKLHDPISEIPPTRLPFGYAILTSPPLHSKYCTMSCSGAPCLSSVSWQFCMCHSEEHFERGLHISLSYSCLE